MIEQVSARPAEQAPAGGKRRDLVVFSHLGWNYVYQRPQHLLTRAARDRRVFYIQEPQFSPTGPDVKVSQPLANLWVIEPFINNEPDPEVRAKFLGGAVRKILEEHAVDDYVAWYYTPYWLRHTGDLSPAAVVYDCMDELTLFRGADPVLVQLEPELMHRAGVVFTGGESLFEAKRDKHPNVHAFPSSIDRAHFAQARTAVPDPADQAGIPHPRLGFFGVIDERMDLALVAGIAAARPDWQIVLIGPVTKINEADLPRAANIHYLGMKHYEELPAYLAGWDVAIMPFARNEATRFISPTKTPEYLAGGKPVVSTGVRDVIRPYGERGLVRIADNVAAFVGAVQEALSEDEQARAEWLARVDAFLEKSSWDMTWQKMDALIEACLA